MKKRLLACAGVLFSTLAFADVKLDMSFEMGGEVTEQTIIVEEYHVFEYTYQGILFKGMAVPKGDNVNIMLEVSKGGNIITYPTFDVAWLEQATFTVNSDDIMPIHVIVVASQV